MFGNGVLIQRLDKLKNTEKSSFVESSVSRKMNVRKHIYFGSSGGLFHTAMGETTAHTQLRSATDSTDGVVEQVVGTLLSADQVVQTDSRLRTVGGRVFLVCAVVISTSLLALEVYRVLKGDTPQTETEIFGHNITLQRL